MSAAIGGSCTIGLGRSAFRATKEKDVVKRTMECSKKISDTEKIALKEKFTRLVEQLKEQRQEKKNAQEIFTDKATRAAFIVLADAIEKEEALLTACEKAFNEAVEAGCYPDVYDPETDKITPAVDGKEASGSSLEEID